MKGFVETSEKDALRFLFQQTLSGDSGDNIKGLSGIGEKKAIEFLDAMQTENFITYYSDCSKVYCLKLGNKLGAVAISEAYRLVRILRTVEKKFNKKSILLKELKFMEWL